MNSTNNWFRLSIAAVLLLSGNAVFAQQKIGDNLGTHKASKTLNMDGNDVDNVRVLNSEGVVIGTASAVNNTSVALQVTGSNKAILLPRVADLLNTTTPSIVSPLEGMIVYDLTTRKFYLRDNNAWVTYATTSLADGKILVGDSNNTPQAVTMSGDATLSNAGVITIGADKITTVKILNGNVTKEKLATDAVTEEKILDLAVTARKVGSGAGNNKVLTTDNTGANLWVDRSKFASTDLNSGQILLGNASNEAIAVAPSGDVTIDNTGVTTIGADKVTTAKILNANVTTAKIADLNVTTDKLAADAVTTAKILNANVTTAKIADLNVTTDKLAADAVTTAKILNANVTTAKIADLNVTTDKLAADAVTTVKILDANVTTGKIADLGVTEGKIAADAVTTSKILNGAVTAVKVGSGAGNDKVLTTDNTGANVWVDRSKFASTDLNSGQILLGNATNVATAVAPTGDVTIDNTGVTTIGADKVTTAKILNANVTTAKIADLNVTTDKLAADAVTTAKILNANVTTAKIADLNVTTDKLAANAVTTAKITDLNVTTDKLAASAVTTAKINDLAVTAAKVGSGSGNDKVLTTNNTGDNVWVDRSKFASTDLTSGQILLGNATNVATAVAPTGDVTIDNTGVTTIGADKVTTAKILNSNVTTAKIADLNVTTDKLAADAVTTAKILNSNVTTAKIADLNVTTDKLAADAVTTVKILDANVTTGKIADLNVTTDKLAANAVTTAKITDLNVTTDKLAASAVTTAKINDLAVTAAKVGSGSGNDKVLTTNNTGDNVWVDRSKFASTDLNSGQILLGNATNVATAVAPTGDVTIDNTGVTTIGADKVTTAKILNSNVTTAKIADLNVTTDKLAADAVTTVKILDANVTTGKIADLNVTTDKLAASAVTTAKINDLAVTAAKVGSGSGNDKVLTTNGTGANVWVDRSKFASTDLTSGQILLGNATNVATAVAPTGDVTISNTGVTTIGADKVTTTKILNENVTAAKLAADAVTTVKILDANVTTGKIADLNVTTDKLAASAVTTAKINDLAVTAAKVGSGSGNDKVLTTNGTGANVWVDRSKFASTDLTSGQILLGNATNVATAVAPTGDVTISNTGVTTIGADKVTTAKILNSNVTTDKIADLNVTTDKLAADAVTTVKILNANVTTAKIANNAVTSAKLSSSTTLDADRAVGTDHIKDKAVTVAKINNGTARQILSTNATGDGVEWVSGSDRYVDLVNKQDNINGLKTFISDSGFVAKGTIGSGAIPATGAGVRMMWYPKKAAFRAGEVGPGGQWDDAAIGANSVAMGVTSMASGFASFAFGSAATASAQYAIAMGLSSTASGSGSVSLGTLVSTNLKSGAFILGDNAPSGTTTNTVNNQFMSRFSGGYRFFTSADTTKGFYAIPHGVVKYKTNVRGRFDALSFIDKGYADSLVSNGPFVNRYLAQTVLGLKTFKSDSGFVATGTFGGAATTIPATGAGTRMMWYPAKSAFRAGTLASTYATYWDDATTGAYSVSMGRNTYGPGEASISMGDFARAFGNNSVALGKNITAGGNNSVVLGSAASTFTSGSDDASGKNGSFVFADASTTTYTRSSADNQMMMRFAGGYRFYTSSDLASYIDIAAGANGMSITSDRRRKENFAAVNGEDFLQKIDTMQLSSWNYKKQDPKIFRHYGPMAQDFYKAFGRDSYGTIGNDTTIASADFDGVNMIAIQGLIKRTNNLKKENDTLKEQNAALIKQVSEQKEENAVKMAALEAQLLEQKTAMQSELKKIMDLLQEKSLASGKTESRSNSAKSEK